jgi:hypothetical protein
MKNLIKIQDLIKIIKSLIKIIKNLIRYNQGKI